MSLKLELKPTSVIVANLGLEPSGPVHAEFTKRCAEHMDKYVPYKEGGLAYDTRRIEKDKVIYEAPYAHYMYEGRVMGPNIPIKENGKIVGWFSPKGKNTKYYTGKKIKYHQSAGHEYAGHHWDKRMWSAESKEIIKELQDYIHRGVK